MEEIFEYKQIDGDYLIDMQIIKVKESKEYPEGIKYSLVAIDRKTGKRILGLDNHEKKGHHIHILRRELKYKFVDWPKLIEDFEREFERIKKRL